MWHFHWNFCVDLCDCIDVQNKSMQMLKRLTLHLHRLPVTTSHFNKPNCMMFLSSGKFLVSVLRRSHSFLPFFTRRATRLSTLLDGVCIVWQTFWSCCWLLSGFTFLYARVTTPRGGWLYVALIAKCTFARRHSEIDAMWPTVNLRRIPYSTPVVWGHSSPLDCTDRSPQFSHRRRPFTRCSCYVVIVVCLRLDKHVTLSVTREQTSLFAKLQECVNCTF